MVVTGPNYGACFASVICFTFPGFFLCRAGLLQGTWVCALRLHTPLRFPERLSCLNGVYAEVAQLVEHLLAMQKVAGSSPVFRSISLPKGFMRK